MCYEPALQRNEGGTLVIGHHMPPNQQSRAYDCMLDANSRGVL